MTEWIKGPQPPEPDLLTTVNRRLWSLSFQHIFLLLITAHSTPTSPANFPLGISPFPLSVQGFGWGQHHPLGHVTQARPIRAAQFPQGLNHWLRDGHVSSAETVKVITRILTGNTGKKSQLSAHIAIFVRRKPRTGYANHRCYPLGKRCL